MLELIRSTAILTVLSFLCGCVNNAPFRTDTEPNICLALSEQCGDGKSMIERYKDFDLSFIEFTERGNLFSREHANNVLSFIDAQAKLPEGVAVLVFAHGWKHNADPTDSNVQEFKDLVSQFKKNQVLGNRKVIGVYLGWRGRSVTIPVIQELSYWDRKSVAEEIGGGGATDILSRLHEILVARYAEHNLSKVLYKNVFVVIGHSFGAALVLSALDDVYTNNLANAHTSLKENQQIESCKKVNRFADGVILLNPAIEANKGMQIKELASNCRFPSDQARLMHVISSEADTATRVAFPAGQWLDLVLTWDQEVLTRNVVDRDLNPKTIKIKEYDLDIRTIGNYKNFRTGKLELDKNEINNWLYKSCKKSGRHCGVDETNLFPIQDNNPVSFIQTDGDFMKGHNDVFNCQVQSYISTILLETQTVDKGYDAVTHTQNENTRNISRNTESCSYGDFSFGPCFKNQLDLFCGKE